MSAKYNKFPCRNVTLEAFMFLPPISLQATD